MPVGTLGIMLTLNLVCLFCPLKHSAFCTYYKLVCLFCQLKHSAFCTNYKLVCLLCQLKHSAFAHIKDRPVYSVHSERWLFHASHCEYRSLHFAYTEHWLFCSLHTSGWPFHSTPGITFHTMYTHTKIMMMMMKMMMLCYVI